MKKVFLVFFSLMLLFAGIVNAEERHYGCRDHDAYVAGTEVLLRTGPGTSYGIAAVTNNHMHLYLHSLVGENYQSFAGIANCDAKTFIGGSYGPTIPNGQALEIKKRIHGGKASIIGVLDGREISARFNEFYILNNTSLWYEVTTEFGQRGYIFYKYVKPLGDYPDTGYRYYDNYEGLYYYY